MKMKPWAVRAIGLGNMNMARESGPSPRGNIHRMVPSQRSVPDTIMIVDPNPVRLGDLSDMAQAAGLRVLAFSDAHAALGWLSEKPMPEQVIMAWTSGSWASERLSSLLSVCRANFLIYARDVTQIPEKFTRYASAVIPVRDDMSVIMAQIGKGASTPLQMGSRHLSVC